MNLNNYIFVIPGGGGKTTLSKKGSCYIDIDNYWDINGETEIYIDTFTSEDYNDLEKGKLPKTVNAETNIDIFNVSVKDLRKMVNYLSTHKLPVVYNTHITSELSNKMNNKVLKYVKQ